MKTLSLTSDWDLTLDSTGNLVVLTDKAAILQDVCSAARTWLGEVLYDTGPSLHLPLTLAYSMASFKSDSQRRNIPVLSRWSLLMASVVISSSGTL